MSWPITSLQRLRGHRDAPSRAQPPCACRLRRRRRAVYGSVALAALSACLFIGCTSFKLQLPKRNTGRPADHPSQLALAGASAAAAAKSVQGAMKVLPAASGSATEAAAEKTGVDPAPGAKEDAAKPAAPGLAPTDPTNFQPPGGLKVYPVDLSAALKLAGANHLQIALAKERTREAEARFSQASVRWLPTLQAGVGYTLHDGLMQMPDGSVVEQRESALFTGGGATIGSQIPLAGPSTGPSRLSAQVSIADAIFEPLAARQTVRAAVAREDAVFHLGMLHAATAYLALQRAHARAGVQASVVLEGDQLASFAAGRAKPDDANAKADVAYVEAAALRRRQEMFAEQERAALASATLARVLQLDPSILLSPSDTTIAPLELFDGEKTLSALVADAWACRPEVREQKAILKQADFATQQAYWQPWLPNLYVGYGSGQFAASSAVQSREGARSDFDAVALWRLDNLGAGPRTAQRTEVSKQRQAVLIEKDVRDAVAGETAEAYHKTMHGRRALESAGALVAAAQAVWNAERAALSAGKSRFRIAADALDQWRIAQLDLIDRTTAVNIAQFELLHAVGRSTNLVKPATPTTKPAG